ncbi:MAG: PQQ-binding-like beta-propeller repeat protein [Planctomycetaceae bacterium]
MMYRLRSAVLFLVSTCIALAPLSAEDWPNWRGPRGDGTSVETDLPVRWSAAEGENIAWKTPLSWPGHASPIVAGERVFVVGADEPVRRVPARVDESRKRVLSCFDRDTGKQLWERVVLETPLESLHSLNSRASSTPAADEKRVYVSFLDGDRMFVAAYDHAGKRLWQVRPGVFSSKHGYCSSPVLFENLVIVNGDHDGPAYLVALDRETGETVWKSDRENRTRSYCTPIIREVGGRTRMMLSGSLCVASYDPRTGERQWIIDGPTEQFVASCVYSHGLLFVTGGYPDRHILAIDPDAQGNVTKTHVRWRHAREGVSYVPSPIVVGDWFFITSDNGIGSCFDAKTGELQWRERMARHYSGSPVAADGHVYFTDDDGITKVVRAAAKYELVAENRLGEAVYSSAAISGGSVFIRGEGHLWRIGREKRAEE